MAGLVRWLDYRVHNYTYKESINPCVPKFLAAIVRYLSYAVGQGNPLGNHILHVIEGHHYIILKHLSIANNFAMLQNVT